MDPWPSKGRLLGRPGTFLGESEKRNFFDVAPGVEKVGQNRPLGAQGSKKALRLLRKCDSLARRVPGAASRARTSKEKNDRGAAGAGSDTPWAVGPANFSTKYEINIYNHDELNSFT